MSLPSQEPDPGRKTGNRRWVYLPVKGGTQTVGFLAGYPVGVWCHWSSGSRPCKRMMTRGKLSCCYCADNKEPEWRGYTPLYSREYVPVFVLVTAEYLESVREIAPHGLVKISRDKDTHAPIVITPSPWRTTPLPPSPQRVWPVDLMPFLLRLWKDSELIQYAITNTAGVTSDTGVSLPMRDPPITTPETREAGARELKQIGERIKNRLKVKPAVDVSGIGEMPSPERNGVHKPE